MRYHQDSIAIIGCGNVGEQILRHLRHDLGSRVRILITRRDKRMGTRIAKKYSAEYLSSNVEAVKQAKIVWLCVRPWQMLIIASEIRPVLRASQMLISIAAAISHRYLKHQFPKNPVIRYLPSPLLEERLGVALLSGDRLPQPHQRMLQSWSSLLLGILDGDMHLYTVFASCSSAYLTSFMLDSLQGNSSRQRMQLKDCLLASIIDTCRYLQKKKVDEWQHLVQFAATPGGMTEAGLTFLQTEETQDLIRNVINASAQRSHELQKKYER